MDELYNLYHDDEDFKEYVDKYCAARGLSIFEAFRHKLVRIIAERTEK